MRKIRPTHLRRSWLFVGAANDAHIEKASLSEADVCIQEFEDFCVPERRDYARNIMPEVLNTWERQGIRKNKSFRGSGWHKGFASCH